MSDRVNDNVARVRDILKRKSTLTFEDLKSLVGNLKGEKSFGDTRKLLQYAQQRPNLKDHSDWIAQQLALCTYKDQDLHVDIKFDSAMSILQKSVDLANTEDPETLGIVGAIHKHLNFLGRYHFSLPGDVRGGVLRELRDPNAGLEEEWLLPVGSP